MTYPDRQPRRDSRILWLILVILFLAIYLPFALEAKARQEVCISAATIDETGTVVSTPVVCR